MKYLILTALILFSGCDTVPANEDPVKHWDRYYMDVCVRGHIYLQSHREFAIQLTDDGKPIKCIKEKL